MSISTPSSSSLLKSSNLIPERLPSNSSSNQLVIEENPRQACLIKVARMIEPIFIFKTLQKALNPCGCSNPLSCLSINILAFIITVVLLILLLPIRLILTAITYTCMPRSKKIVTPPLRRPSTIEIEQVIIPFDLAMQELLYLDNKPRLFRINPNNLTMMPEPNPVLRRLSAISDQESKKLMQQIPNLCRELEKILKKLGVLTSEWEKMLMYFNDLALEDNSFDDKRAFPALINILIEALTCKAPFFSDQSNIPSLKEKQQAALFIAQSSYTCKPTWAEVMIRALIKLYSRTNQAQNQLLLWVQQFKEETLLNLQDGAANEYESIGQKKTPNYTKSIEIALKQEAEASLQWHILNTIKYFYGEKFGLVTEHLKGNVGYLTLRQTSIHTNEGPEKAQELAVLFESLYLSSGNKLIENVFKAFQKADSETQTLVRDFALDILKEALQLGDTDAHVDIFSKFFVDAETSDLNIMGITYLLYAIGIIEPVQ
ncbi:Domain of Unknown Function (DUF1548) [Chlamydia serpentis]|uniref:Uncharacterized protein n=1 Tax=Chlamydia serpentis TaxID=1967782 RepID=A0A2R8FCI4_9CHLA|nr:DUF1548 domain-containing protein [Chlamydia serpentis]SPN74071.1 Domain of Unknown Function (DUF1548) [Chlamydia serpentis]